MLIPISTTHFVQARFKQARLPCGLNSCITLYFILLSIAQAHATYGEIEKVWFGGYGLVPLDLLHEPSPCVLPSGQGTLVAPQAHGIGLVSKISTPK